MVLHTNWRDCKAWSDEGLKLSTTSNEAAKMYDAILTQYTGWYDEKSVGGMEKCLDAMLAADQNFVMGHVISLALECMGTGVSQLVDHKFAGQVKLVSELERQFGSSGSGGLTERERMHVSAVKLWADGKIPESCDVYERLLVSYPTDMLAVKVAHDSYFYMGQSTQMRDSTARVLPHWKPHMPLYGYMQGMHAFGLEECNLYEDAEKAGKLGLELNRNDAWSTHALAHVYEMTGRYKHGDAFLRSTEADWAPCNYLCCHNYWHWGLYNIEQGNYDAALQIYDENIAQMVKSSMMLDIVDGTSFLYRLTMEGVDVSERWHDVYETCRAHLDDHILVFNDLHLMFSVLGDGHPDVAHKLLAQIEEYAADQESDVYQYTRGMMSQLGADMCKALIHYDSGHYMEAVNLLLPLRYRVRDIGGSHAQRDVFSQLLIHSCLKSSDPFHNKLARSLLAERKSLKQDSPLTDRLIQQAIAVHGTPTST